MATALETALQTEIAKITDAITAAYASEKLTEYIAAKAALAAQAGNDVISYSFAGRSVTRMQANQFRQHVADVESELARIIYGQTSLIDGSVVAQ